MTGRVLERTPIYDPLCVSDAFVEDVERYLFAKQFVKGQKVVDIACGTGFGSHLLWAEGGARWVLGIDSAPEALSQTARFIVPGTVEFSLARAEQIPAESGSVDVVISAETIEHLEEPGPFLEELRRILRPGGRAVISTPLNNSTTRLQPENPYHHREYSTEEFTQLVVRAFGNVELYTQLTTYKDDLFPETLAADGLVSSSRRILRQVAPPSLRRAMRKVIGSKGLHPVQSRIAKGLHELGSVQIAVCNA